MTKTIIMYRTALHAQNTRNSTKSFGLKASCDDLITKFNKGEHIVDDENEQNTYSILNDC